MGWLDHQEETGKNEGTMEEFDLPEIDIMLPDGRKYVRMNINQADIINRDDLGGALLVIIDEVAELLMPSGVKTAEGKEEDALKQECTMIIQSITQLGRAAGIHMILATQRNDSSIIPGLIQNNPLSLDTKLIVKNNQNNIITKTMGDIKEDDKVFGLDKEWHNIKLQPIHIPYDLYKLTFSQGLFESWNILGSVKCSGDHYWKVYDPINNRWGEFTTRELLYDANVITYRFGQKDGPMLAFFEELPKEEVRCIEVLDSEDHLFQIQLESEGIKDSSIFSGYIPEKDPIDSITWEVIRG